MKEKSLRGFPGNELNEFNELNELTGFEKLRWIDKSMNRSRRGKENLLISLSRLYNQLGARLLLWNGNNVDRLIRGEWVRYLQLDALSARRLLSIELLLVDYH